MSNMTYRQVVAIVAVLSSNGKMAVAGHLGRLLPPCNVHPFGVQRVVIRDVVISRDAMKQLRKVPRHIAKKFEAWVEAVEADGLEETRKIPGYHDEALRGDRAGQRSIRLSRAYRAVYEVKSNNRVEFVNVEEVHNHDY